MNPSQEKATRTARIALKSLFAVAALGGEITAADLAALGVPDRHHRAAVDLGEVIRRHRAWGDRGEARRLADEGAAALLADLGVEWRPSDPYEVDVERLTARELGAFIDTGHLPDWHHGTDPPKEIPR